MGGGDRDEALYVGSLYPSLGKYPEGAPLAISFRALPLLLSLLLCFRHHLILPMRRTPDGGHAAWDAATRLQDPLLPVQHVAVAVTDRLRIDGGRCGPRRHRQEALEQRRVTPVALERRVELWRCRCRACSCLRCLWALWRG